MNRFRLFVPALVAILAVTLSAFTKETTPIKPGKSAFAYAAKSLVMTSFQMEPAIDLDGDGKIDQDLMAFLRPCERDNAIIFEKNGKISSNNGQLSCTEGQADASTINAGSWSYDDATKTIRIVKGTNKADVLEWKVVEATPEGMKVEVPKTEGGKSYRAIITWKAL
jgi:hypothetical protein